MFLQLSDSDITKKNLNAYTFVLINEMHCSSQYVLISNTPKMHNTYGVLCYQTPMGIFVLSFYINAQTFSFDRIHLLSYQRCN